MGPSGANTRGLEENCFKDSSRIVIVRAIAGHTGQLLAMGMRVGSDGLLALDKAQDEDEGAKRPRKMDDDLLTLLDKYDLQDVANDLARNGITSVKVMEEEVVNVDVHELGLGSIRSLQRLLTHLKRKYCDGEQMLTNVDVNKAIARMLAEPLNAHAQRHGCEALHEAGYPGTQTLITEAIRLVTVAMTGHTENPGVQEPGCAALSGLAVNTDNRTAIADIGGISLVVVAMQQHTKQVGVQMQGCWALSNLAINNANNQTAIALAGGIRVVVVAMQQHAAHTGVQTRGCLALRNLAANNDSNRMAIMSAGGIEVVLAAMASVGASVGARLRVQERGCGALCIIGLSGATVQRRIKDEGGMDVVEAVVAAEGASATCKEHGHTLLTKLARV